MFKRIFLICCLTALLFSAQALPFLYTFDGSITKLNNELIDEPIVMNYKLIIDFDELGLFNGSLVDDGWNQTNDIFSNYGSATFDVTTDLYFDSENLVFDNTSNALQKDVYFNGNFSYSESSINHSNFYEDGTFRSFSLISSDFSIGSFFSVTEIFNNLSQDFEARGNVKLTSIVPYGTSSVPEGNTMSLLFLGMVGLTGFRFSRKNI